MKNKVIPHPWFRAIFCRDKRPIGAISVTENSGVNDKCRGELEYVLGSK
jgi:hypothetical protein